MQPRLWRSCVDIFGGKPTQKVNPFFLWSLTRVDYDFPHYVTTYTLPILNAIADCCATKAHIRIARDAWTLGPL
jgi:hypothetical protein